MNQFLIYSCKTTWTADIVQYELTYEKYLGIINDFSD